MSSRHSLRKLTRNHSSHSMRVTCERAFSPSTRRDARFYMRATVTSWRKVSSPIPTSPTMSSPYPHPLPPSSAPGGSPPPSSSYPTSRPVVDPLAFDDVHGLGGSRGGAPRTEAQTGEDITEGSNRPRRTRFEDTNDIPRVKDTTGEKVTESFEMFLER